MKLHVIDTGFFKLDGGAMFGVVPKSLWQRTNPADENNLCTWAMRCLLIEDGDRLILIDNGLGDKQDAKFFSHYYLHGDATLEKSLHAAGFSYADVTDVFLTHLHFDHCGGGVKYKNSDGALELTFPNATYWSNSDHWEWATKPNAREKASFLKENILPMQESGHLQLIDPAAPSPLPQFDIFYANGHTDKMMVPIITYKGRKLAYMADLLPSTGHIPLPYVMGYDTRPLLTLDEKARFMKTAADENYVMFLEHDPVNECCTVQHTEKGIRLADTFKLAEA
ncbi:MBL fold metallo-hydrolase [Pontibacter diazotrophicus]|uniref:MBL fold metallo-hydrolase n=1 Tax=Pontibacter diazotrophicus TaxID=1400979 RepID=A0A3D8LBY9_9BACT|nr:MBL fold metallo-hydrolase [Pontibacter diazotrophicus]RDV14853.1 MBL fold metallo-hydrolase [Pontibacter diazotrophicus]